MGDRANILVKQPTGAPRATNAHKVPPPSFVYLYSHWGGSTLPIVLRDVLKRGARLDDPSYLARIIFCAMVAGHETGDTGFGISSELGDNGYPLLVVDCERQEVYTADERSPETPIKSIAFAGYAKQSDASAVAFRGSR